MGDKYRIINYNENASEFYLPGRSNPVKIYPGEANAVSFEGLTKKEILSLRGLAKVGLILRPVVEKKIEEEAKQVVDLEMDTTGEVTKEDIFVALGQKDDTPQDDTPQDDTPQYEDEGTPKEEQPAEDTKVDTEVTEISEELQDTSDPVVEVKESEVEDKKALRDELVAGRDLKSIPADELKAIFNKLGLSVEGSLTKGKAIRAIEGV